MQDTHLDTSPDSEQSGPASARRRGWILGLVSALVVLAGAYVGLAYYLSTKVPAQATVGGVNVGGQSPERATELVESAVAKIEAEPLDVSVAEESFTLDADRAGLRIDTDATLDGITSFTLDPRDLYEHLTGNFNRDWVLAIDEDKLTAAVTTAAQSLDRDPVEGTVAINEGELAIVDPEQGMAVDVEATTERILAAWPGERAIDGVGGPLEPQTPQAVFDTFRSDFAEKALSGPLTVAVGDETFEVPVAEVLPAMTINVADGAITPEVDGEALTPIVEAAGEESGVLREAKDARVTFSGTDASVAPSQTGVAVDVSDQGPAVVQALTAENRTVTLEPVVTQPKLTTEKAKETLPKGRISAFTTYYSPAPRVTNIKIAANRLNGTYIPPGGQLSLNGILGQRTPDKGYVKAGIILNGRLADSYGGGISQLSTTLYNAAYFAGVEINEFRAHSYYIPRYPEGREATISWGTIDQRWTNNTKGGILVRSWATDTEVTVELWGTKTFEVESVKGPRRNVRQPQEMRVDGAECVNQQPQVGFDVTVTRIIKQDGREVKREDVTTKYDAADHVICTDPSARG